MWSFVYLLSMFIYSTSPFQWRYVKSRSDKQLLYGLKYNYTGSCSPEDANNGLPIVPCGLIAWSLFNDTYSFFRGADALKVNRKNIAWESDRNHKFGKHVYPFNFQNGSLIGGAHLDPAIPVSVYIVRLVCHFQLLAKLLNFFIFFLLFRVSFSSLLFASSLEPFSFSFQIYY